MLKIPSRDGNGGMIVELACAGFLFVGITLLCFDAGVLMAAHSTLDEATRDAGRAAGESTLTAANPDLPRQAAEDALSKHASAGNMFLKNLRLDSFEYKVDAIPDITGIPDNGGAPPGGKVSGTPYVALTASVDAVVPAPILFFGAEFGKGGTLHYSQAAMFPIIKSPVFFDPRPFDANPPASIEHYPCDGIPDYPYDSPPCGQPGSSGSGGGHPSLPTPGKAGPNG